MSRSKDRKLQRQMATLGDSRLDENHLFQDPEFAKPRPKQTPPISALNEAQGDFLANLFTKPIVFGVGPAGTGKTYVATSLAIEHLLSGRIKRIVMSRPMTPCGEDMGFLPGELKEKYMPWLSPVLNVFYDRIGKGKTEMLIKHNQIEFAPLMLMRGASYKDCWVILDEAQNVTTEQMKMFLTRIGDNCKMVVTGDLRQSDLMDGRGVMKINGLEDALVKLKRSPSVGICHFNREDIVRSGIVKEILDRYEA